MRHVVAYLALVQLGIITASAVPKTTPDPLTIVFRFDGPYSEKSLVEMKRELGTILKGSGIQIDWRAQSDVAVTDSFPNLVVVKFRGKCRMEPVPYLYDERGTLGFTYSTDGAVLPFSEIECDKVRSSLHTAMFGGDYKRSDLLFGRALAACSPMSYITCSRKLTRTPARESPKNLFPGPSLSLNGYTSTKLNSMR